MENNQCDLFDDLRRRRPFRNCSSSIVAMVEWENVMIHQKKKESNQHDEDAKKTFISLKIC
jgi:hypothetical protein